MVLYFVAALLTLPISAQAELASALAPASTLRKAFLGDNPVLGRVDQGDHGHPLGCELKLET